MTLVRALGALALVLVLLVGGEVPPTSALAPAPTQADPAAGAGSLIPDAEVGPHPTAHYDLGYDAGAWNDVDRKFFGLLTELAFGCVRWLVGACLWVLGWAFGFGLLDSLGDPTVRVAEIYQAELVGPVGLRHAALFGALVWAGFHGLRGRLQMAAGELALTALVAVLGSMVLANPHGYLEGTFDTTSRISGAFLALGSGPPGDEEPNPTTALEPLSRHLHAAFVEQPYDVLDWGGPLSGACAAARDRVLADGPHGSADRPREEMRRAGCDRAADFNHDPSAERLGGAVLTALAAGVVVLLILMVAVTLLVAQVIAMLLFAVAPFALAAGLVPGGGRELLWRWLAALVRVVLAVVGMSFVMSLLLLVVDAVLQASEGARLIERFALLVLVAVGMLVVRKRIVAAGADLADRMSRRLAAGRVGGRSGGGWVTPATVGGISGFALGAGLRDTAGDLPGAAGYRLAQLGRLPYRRSRHWRTRTLGSRPTTAPGPRPQGFGATLTRAGEAVGATRPGRVATGTARLAAGTAAVAYKSTLGLPVHGPRAYRAAAAAASARRDQIGGAVGDYRREYAANLARLRRRRRSG